MTVRTEEIQKSVAEEGTAFFMCSFIDEDGLPATPISMYWDLTALDGTVIEYNQQVTDLLPITYVMLSGPHLRILAGENSYGERLLTFKIVYNSTRGNSLPVHKQVKFKVQNLKLFGYPLSVVAVDAIFTDDYVQQVA